jgi:tetraacyldisaccharide 4'-kinase
MKLDSLWYGRHPLALALAPLSWLFCGVVGLRRAAYRAGLLRSYRAPVPVIVVGNLSVGGTGKTPLVIWLAKFLLEQGFRPGIVSRGYGGNAKTWPQAARADSDPRTVGDEAIVLAKHSAGCPVAVGPDRPAAVRSLIDTHRCNVIISDDGMQHYAMQRDIEIAVVDDLRRFGNGLCLPAGPLREPLRRLKDVQFVVSRGAAMQGEIGMKYQVGPLRGVINEHLAQPLSALRGQSVHAIAALGDTERFFNRLRDEGLKIRPHAFPDHHFFRVQDIDFKDDLPVIMTEKDAVKCRAFAQPRHWYLAMEAQLPASFGEQVLKLLQAIRRAKDGQKTA